MPEVIAPASREFELRQSDALERLFARYTPQIVIDAVAVVGRTGATRANPDAARHSGTFLKCVESVEEGREVTALWGDGSPTREFLHAGDAANGIIEAVQQYDKPEPVSIGSGEEISIQSLAEQIAVLSGFTGRVVWDTLQLNGQPRRRLGTSRAEREFGFRARTSFYGGLREIIEWHVNARGGGLARGGISSHAAGHSQQRG